MGLHCRPVQSARRSKVGIAHLRHCINDTLANHTHHFVSAGKDHFKFAVLNHNTFLLKYVQIAFVC